MRSKSQKFPWSLLWALLFSIAFHSAVVFLGLAWIKPPPPPQEIVLNARLVATPAQEEYAAAVLKNTLEEVTPSVTVAPVRRQAKDAAGETAPEATAPPKMEPAPRQESPRLIYPPEALAQGLEGEPVLIVEVDASGRILSVTLGSTSGHPILDNAAINYVRELGKLEALRGKTVLFPVKFYLQ